MGKVRHLWWITLALGISSLLVVPFLVPIDTSGTQSEGELAGEDSTFITVGNLQVHYEFEAYRGSMEQAPLFVLLHGFGASTFSFREVLDDFADLGDVLAYDRPAFGLTVRPTSWTGDSPYRAEAQLDLLFSLIHEFAKDGQPVILVGHSAGGTLAVHYSYRHPGEISALILVAPAILNSSGGPGWLSWIYDIPQVDRLGPLLVRGIASRGSELLERSWHDPRLLSDSIRAGYQKPLQVKGWEKAFWEFYKAPGLGDLREELIEIIPPVVIITGDHDRVVPTADSRILSQQFPEWQLVVIGNSGHLPHEENPEEFMASLREGLAGFPAEVLGVPPAVEVTVSEVFSEEESLGNQGVDCQLVPCVALTFDDGPGPFTPEIVDMLSEFEATATFYVVGTALKWWPTMLPLIVESGHEVGNHTMTHPRLGDLGRAAQRKEIEGLDDVVFSSVGVQPQSIRPPYGDLPRSGIPDAHQRPVVMWSVDSFDWKKRSPRRISADVLQEAKPGDIILMHELSRRGVDALPTILQGLKDKGLQVVSVSQLLGTGFVSADPVERVPFTCPMGTVPANPPEWCGVSD